MALDRASFEELFRAHAARVYSIGVRITGDRATAEDVVQETFVKAYTVADTTVFDDIGAWLSTVARNASLNAVRDRSRTVGLAEDAVDGVAAGSAGSAILLVDVSPSADPERAAASSDAVRGAWELVDGLRPEARAAVVLRYAEDLPIEVIARTLGKSVNATTVLLHRARASLRAAYAARVFARAGLPDACRSRREEIVDLVEGRPVSDELRAHMAACSHCQQSADELRGMTRGFAVAPLFVVPAALGLKIAAVLGAAGVAGAAGVGGAATAAGAAAAGATGAAAGASATTAAAGAAATAAGVGAAGATGAAAAGGFFATIGHVIVAGLAVVAVVGTVGIASARNDRAGRATPTADYAAVPSGPVDDRLSPPPVGPGSSGAPVIVIPGSPSPGPLAESPSPVVSPSAAASPVSSPTTDPVATDRPAAAATPAATARPATTPAPTPRRTDPPAATARPTAAPTHAATPGPAATPVSTPTPAVTSTSPPPPSSRPGMRPRWTAGPSCGTTARRFRAGDVIWVTLRGYTPGIRVTWRIKALPGSHPARLVLTGALEVGGNGAACAPIWTVPAASEASGLFRVDVGRTRKIVRLNGR